MTLEYIKSRVESKTGIKNLEKKGSTRQRVIARCIYADLAYRFTTSPYSKIAGVINKDHSTVVYYLDVLQTHLLHENKFRIWYEILKRELKEESQNPELLTAKEEIFLWFNKIPNKKYPELMRKLHEIEL